MNKQSLIKRLFNFAGKYKYLTILGVILSGISAILGLFPIIFIWLGLGEIFDMYPNFIVTITLERYAYMAVFLQYYPFLYILQHLCVPISLHLELLKI